MTISKSSLLVEREEAILNLFLLRRDEYVSGKLLHFSRSNFAHCQASNGKYVLNDAGIGESYRSPSGSLLLIFNDTFRQSKVAGRE